MATAERLINSIREDRASIHVLLWDDKEELVKVVLTMLAGLNSEDIEPLLVSTGPGNLFQLQSLARTRFQDDVEANPQIAARLWMLFVQQGVAVDIGPWLNGYRRPLADAGGTLLVLRKAEMGAFQRGAPDLASFVGSHIYDAATMLFLVADDVSSKLTRVFPVPLKRILDQLPGEHPSDEDVERWIESMRPSSV
jgi:hypothetical protein